MNNKAITFRFASTNGFPKTWHVHLGKKYTALVKKCDEYGMSVIFIDDSGQLINTVFAKSYFINKRSLIMC